MGRAQRFLCAASVVSALALAPGSAAGDEKEDLAKPVPPRTLADPSLEETLPMRVIRVRIACDEEFRRRVDWEEKARRRLRLASEVFEREFRIRWRCHDVVKWRSNDFARNLEPHFPALDTPVRLQGVDVVLGITAQRPPRGPNGDRIWNERGRAQLLGRVALLRVDPNSMFDRRTETNTLLHELGHVLGAWHTSTPSIMSGGRVDELSFGPRASAVIRATRTIDFSRGVESLSERQIAVINEQWRQEPDETQWHPVASAWMRRGWKLNDLFTVDQSLKAYQNAIDAFAAIGEPRHGLVADCFYTMGYMEVRRGNLRQAAVHLERAATIRHEEYTDEDPVGAAAMALAQVLVQIREWGRAEEWYRKALESRVHAYGVPSERVAETLRYLGRFLDCEGRTREADTVLEHALTVSARSGSGGAYVTRARGRLRLLRGLGAAARRRPVTEWYAFDEPIFDARSARKSGEFDRPGHGRSHVRVAKAAPPIAKPAGWSKCVIDVPCSQVTRIKARVVHRRPQHTDGARHVVRPALHVSHEFEREPIRELQLVLAWRPRQDEPDRYDARLMLMDGRKLLALETGVLEVPPAARLQLAHGAAPDAPAFTIGKAGVPMIARVWKWASVDGAGVPDFDVPMHTWFLTVKFDAEE